ncbi:MAG: hypothetical protein ACOYKC_09175 [Anaerolineaceae bacterium]|jgi:MFS family permease
MDELIGVVFGPLMLIMAFSFLAETLVEFLFGRIADHFPVLTPYRWTLVYLAVGVGLLGAFNWQFDLIYLLGQAVEFEVEKTVLGIVVTGIAIGMGAAYIHQFISKFFPSKNQQAVK